MLSTWQIPSRPNPSIISSTDTSLTYHLPCLIPSSVGTPSLSISHNQYCGFSQTSPFLQRAMCYIHLFYSYNLASWLVHYILKKCLLNEQIHSYSMIFNSYLLLYVLHSMIQKRYLNEDQGQPWRRNSHKIKGWLCMRLLFLNTYFGRFISSPLVLTRLGLLRFILAWRYFYPYIIAYFEKQTTSFLILKKIF